MFYVLFDFFLRLKHHPFVFAAHLFVLCTLVFMVLSSLLVCIARDPGLPNVPSRLEGADGTGEEMGLSEALIADDDFLVPGRWCRKCWVRRLDQAEISLSNFAVRPQNQRELITVHCVGVVCSKWVRSLPDVRFR